VLTLRLVALEAALRAAATTTAAAAAEGTTGSAATTAAAFFAGTRFIHREGTAMEVFAIEKLDGFLGFLGGSHGDEGEATGFAGHAVLHEGGFRDGAGLLEEIFKFEFEGLKREIAYV